MTDLERREKEREYHRLLIGTLRRLDRLRAFEIQEGEDEEAAMTDDLADAIRLAVGLLP